MDCESIRRVLVFWVLASVSPLRVCMWFPTEKNGAEPAMQVREGWVLGPFGRYGCAGGGAPPGTERPHSPGRERSRHRRRRHRRRKGAAAAVVVAQTLAPSLPPTTVLARTAPGAFAPLAVQIVLAKEPK